MDTLSTIAIFLVPVLAPFPVLVAFMWAGRA